MVEADEVYTRVEENLPAEDSPGWTLLLVERNSRWWGPTVVGLRRWPLFLFGILLLVKWAKKCLQLTFLTDGERQYAEVLWAQPGFTVSAPAKSTGKRGRPRKGQKCWRPGLTVARKVKGSQQARGSSRSRYERPFPHHPHTPPLDDQEIHANHCEALNSAIRRRCAAYHRRMNHYAKVPEGLVRALTVIQIAHNWIRPHDSLPGKMPPAMALGRADRPWKFQDFLIMRYQPDFGIEAVSVI
jgi:hypothetical protein